MKRSFPCLLQVHEVTKGKVRVELHVPPDVLDKYLSDGQTIYLVS